MAPDLKTTLRGVLSRQNLLAFAGGAVVGGFCQSNLYLIIGGVALWLVTAAYGLVREVQDDHLTWSQALATVILELVGARK